jgi:hypothetical protein
MITPAIDRPLRADDSGAGTRFEMLLEVEHRRLFSISVMTPACASPPQPVERCH